MPLSFWGLACGVAVLAVVVGTALAALVQSGSCGPLAGPVVIAGGTGGVVLGLGERSGGLAVLVDLEELEDPEMGVDLAGLVARAGPGTRVALGVLAEARWREQPRTPPFGECGSWLRESMRWWADARLASERPRNTMGHRPWRTGRGLCPCRHRLWLMHLGFWRCSPLTLKWLW